MHLPIRVIRLALTLMVLCSIVSNAAAFEVHGDIAIKWQSLGGQKGFLGAPLTNETAAPDGVGRYNHFEHGSIYWRPNSKAFEIHGFIRDKWASLGWERSFLGYPLSDELGTGDGRGRISSFQHGAIVWTAETGARVIYGDVRTKWTELGAGSGFLGYPVEDEKIAPDKVGRYVHFEHGTIYWSKATGAHEVHGFIRDKWAKLAWERGRMRYPTSDEYQWGEYRRSNFQGGFITWKKGEGATASGPIDSGTALNPVDDD